MFSISSTRNITSEIPNITGTFGAGFTQSNFFNEGYGAFYGYIREPRGNFTVPSDSTVKYLERNNFWGMTHLAHQTDMETIQK